jgi:hypothetical protein
MRASRTRALFALLDARALTDRRTRTGARALTVPGGCATLQGTHPTPGMPPTRRRLTAEIDGLAGAGRFGTDAGQGVLAGAVVGQLATALLQHRAVDFTKARSLVLDAGQGRGREEERWRVGRVGDQRRRAGAEHEAEGGRQRRAAREGASGRISRVQSSISSDSIIAIARRLCLDLRRRKVSARVETMVVSEAPPASPEGGSRACDYSQPVIGHRRVLA